MQNVILRQLAVLGISMQRPTRENTLAGLDEKFEHTLFNFVQMSTNLICKVLTVWFSIYIIKTLLYQLFELISSFLKFHLPELIIQSPKPRGNRTMLVVASARKNIQQKYLAARYFFQQIISSIIRNRFLAQVFLALYISIIGLTSTLLVLIH